MSGYSYMEPDGTNVAYNTAEIVKTKTDGPVRFEATVSDKDGNTWNLIYTKAIETAVDNGNAADKAVKVIENGQVVIIKNGVKMNIHGAQIK